MEAPRRDSEQKIVAAEAGPRVERTLLSAAFAFDFDFGFAS
jgi:hypothetical protein